MAKQGSWLPRNFHLKLTAIELGALMQILNTAKKRGEGKASIQEPGPDGEPIETTIIDVLIERANEPIAALVEAT